MAPDPKFYRITISPQAIKAEVLAKLREELARQLGPTA